MFARLARRLLNAALPDNSQNGSSARMIGRRLMLPRRLSARRLTRPSRLSTSTHSGRGSITTFSLQFRPAHERETKTTPAMIMTVPTNRVNDMDSPRICHPNSVVMTKPRLTKGYA